MLYKIFASDLDGTLLNSNSSYDHLIFNKMVRYLNEHDMHFVAATGNQYQHVKEIFSEVSDKIDYVAENGAVVVAHNKIIYENFLNKMSLFTLVEDLLKDPYLKGAQIILSGRDHAYINSDSPQIELASKFYSNLIVTDKLHEVASYENFYKIALNWPTKKDISNYLNYIRKNFSAIRATSSGRSGIDIISHKISKSSGLAMILNNYNLNNNNLMVFGDNGNDLEMINDAGHGVAVQNAILEVKEAANEVLTETNDQNAVLNKITKTLIENGAIYSNFYLEKGI